MTKKPMQLCITIIHIENGFFIQCDNKKPMTDAYDKQIFAKDCTEIQNILKHWVTDQVVAFENWEY